MKNDDIKLKNISACIYDHLEGENSDIPKDEYDTEGSELLKRLNNAVVDHMSPGDVSRVLNSIFLDRMNHDYRLDQLLPLSEAIIRILSEETKHTR